MAVLTSFSVYCLEKRTDVEWGLGKHLETDDGMATHVRDNIFMLTYFKKP